VQCRFLRSPADMPILRDGCLVFVPLLSICEITPPKRTGRAQEYSTQLIVTRGHTAKLETWSAVSELDSVPPSYGANWPKSAPAKD